MKNSSKPFHAHETIHALKHYLPTQAPLKDFIHHNSLHAFQDQPFHKALRQANAIFGCKVYLQLDEYRKLYREGIIKNETLEHIILEKNPRARLGEIKEQMLSGDLHESVHPRTGRLRSAWKTQHKVNPDHITHPLLFRLVSNYLDQGISIHHFPVLHGGFLSTVRAMVGNSYVSLFRSKRAEDLLMDPGCTISSLLEIIVGDESLFEHYIFDQQFAHPGWSGMVALLEDDPSALLDQREISLHDFIMLELLMEIDVLETALGKSFEPLATRLEEMPGDLFAEVPGTTLSELYTMWQEAYEWSYYDQVLNGLIQAQTLPGREKNHSMEAFFCIDDRELSLRRYIESIDPAAETHSTPGFFNVEFYFRPEHGKFNTKVCPAPVKPGHLIEELGAANKHEADFHFTKHSHSLVKGWLISQTLGFWSAFKLFLNIFKPALGPATSYSFRHMDRHARLTIENTDPNHKKDGLQIGFTIEEMADRVEGLLKSTGRVHITTPVIYMVGHGASSINNTHYAGYDCGACSGRPGSVNARVFSAMANHPKVREILSTRGIHIAGNTQFLGALHDTTRDEIEWYDEELLSPENKIRHQHNKQVFEKALHMNAKERSRRFILMNTRDEAVKIHSKIKLRSVSLFEPRPELNHATNALAIIGGRHLTQNLFLDRRAFSNSYDYKVDPEGTFLLNILKAAAPVCGGINLEYYFSRTDPYRLGAGSKLPHNVMGLIGVANGTDGDLRPGLPYQMVEVHDPLRLLMIVEHYPEVLLDTIMRSPETYEWFANGWIHLIAIHPLDKTLFRFRDGAFSPYKPLPEKIATVTDLTPLIENTENNLPVLILNHNRP